MNSLYSGPYSRILLIKPGGTSGLAFALTPIPLGLESIAGNIRDQVEDIIIYDQILEEEPLSRLLQKFKPDLVGFSMSATEHNTGGDLMNIVKKFDPKIPIIAGGFHPTGAPELVLNELRCDVVCRGEGEEIMKDITQGIEWAQIDGLSFKNNSNGNEIIHNKDRDFIKNLDDLPFPARDLRKRRGYHYKHMLQNRRSEYDLMYFGRGCYGKCTFCCEPYFSKGVQRYRSPERTMEEIREIWKIHDKRPMRILISDPHILGHFRKVDRLCDLLIEADLDITFQVMCRTEAIVKQPKIVEKMIRAGMISWELGIESPGQDDLDNTSKNNSIAVQRKAVDILRKLGGSTLGTYVIGLPDHSQSFIKTFPDHALEIGCSSAAFGIATPFPGTGYWDELSSKGLIFEKNWAKFDENYNVFKHPSLSPIQIESLRGWCMAKFWNLDSLFEETRLEKIRVGKFRAKYKENVRDFITRILKKLQFATSAGTELAEKGENAREDFNSYLKLMFDAWADPRIEKYFKKHPMHEIIDMRKFGKIFGNKRIQIVVEDKANKKCIFAMMIIVNKKGIETINVSKKPSKDYDFLLRADYNCMYMDSSFSTMDKLKHILGILTHRDLQIKGFRTIIKMALYGLSEAISIRINNGKSEFV